MRVIAVSGWKGSGKDTVAEYLVKEQGYTRFGFADTLKDMVALQYNIPRESCDEVALKERGLSQYIVDPKDGFSEMISTALFKEFRLENETTNPYIDFDDYDGRDDNTQPPLFWTPRALCILEGSVKRSVNSGHWVQKVIDNINLAASVNLTGEYQGNFVISDLRYRSEVAQLEEAFGDNLTVVRVNRFTHVNSTDPSERDLDNYKFNNIIDNTGTLNDLYNAVDKL